MVYVQYSNTQLLPAVMFGNNIAVDKGEGDGIEFVPLSPFDKLYAGPEYGWQNLGGPIGTYPYFIENMEYVSLIAVGTVYIYPENHTDWDYDAAMEFRNGVKMWEVLSGGKIRDLGLDNGLLPTFYEGTNTCYLSSGGNINLEFASSGLLLFQTPPIKHSMSFSIIAFRAMEGDLFVQPQEDSKYYIKNPYNL